MLALKLSEVVRAEEVVVNVVDPSFTPGTSFFRDVPFVMRVFLWPLAKLTGTTVNNAAWRYVDAAVSRGKESHGSFISDWVIHPYVPYRLHRQIPLKKTFGKTDTFDSSFHPFMYTEEGRRFMDRLWLETTEELGLESLYKAIKS